MFPVSSFARPSFRMLFLSFFHKPVFVVLEWPGLLPDDAVRDIDAYTNTLDLHEQGFTHTQSMKATE
jgi:hypothetical protein